jgi:hypothetical protein
MVWLSTLEFQIPTGQRDDKNNKNRKSTRAIASDTESFFRNAAELLDCFCNWVHYHLLNPVAKGIEQLATSCQENGLQAESRQSIFGTL